MKIERLQPREPRWRQKFRDALEKEADNILAVVGIMSAIWAWREWMAVGAAYRDAETQAHWCSWDHPHLG